LTSAVFPVLETRELVATTAAFIREEMKR